jgi:hypothetical protein
MVVWTCTPPHARNGGMDPHATDMHDTVAWDRGHNTYIRVNYRVLRHATIIKNSGI